MATSNIQSAVDKLSIRNVKGSCLVPDRSQEWIVQRCKELEIEYKVFPNFVQLYFYPTSLRVSFFKRRQSTSATTIHTNVTGCASLQKLEDTVSILATFLKCGESGIVSKVDNITATTNMRHLVKNSINLLECIPFIESNSSQQLTWRFNQETFSGLCVYGLNCTAIVYSTTNIVLVGGKSWRACQDLTKIIEDIIQLVVLDSPN